MRRLGRSTAQISAAIGLAAIAMATPLAWVNAQQAPRPTSGPEANPLDTSKALMAKTKQSLNLKPHAAPLTITPREKIPLDKIKVPAGFKVELWAHGIPGARTLRRGDKGTIFVGSRVIGKVYAVTDKGGERSVKTIVEGQKMPNGLAFHDGALYVMAIDKALRLDGIEDKLDSPQVTDISDKIDLPESTHHNWKYAAIGPDKKLYIAIGSPCNVCEINTGLHGQIRRQNLDILDIPLAEITRQYVDYIEMMQELKLELAAEYLVMAAILIFTTMLMLAIGSAVGARRAAL